MPTCLSVWGLPRSGTTIVCRVLNSLPGACFLCEPLTEQRNGHPISRFPQASTLKEALRLSQAPLRGFKELVRTPADPFYMEWRAQPDWRTVYVIRHPRDVWASLKAYKWPNGYRQVPPFIELARWYYGEIPDGAEIIVYERFVQNPNETLKRLGLPVLEGPLAPLPSQQGDGRAKEAAVVEPQPWVSLPGLDEDKIHNSELISMYEMLAAQAQGVQR